MSNETPAETAASKGSTPSKEQILDLLLEALHERQQARQAPGRTGTTSQGTAPPPSPAPSTEPPAPAVVNVPPTRPEPPASQSQRPAARPPVRPLRENKPGPDQEEGEPPAKLPSIEMGKMLGRLAVLIVILIAIVNIPVTRYGVSLARILPETSSLIIRDGLVLKGSGPEIYVLESNQLRWISSLDAFEHLGLTWQDVHVVEDEFLGRFEKGRPIHVLLKCQASPHVYRLENDQKRWIKDIDTFLAEGHVWEDVRFVTCDYLRGLRNGPSIPDNAGPPPEP